MEDRQGDWHVVRCDDHVQRTDETLRVKIYLGGAIGRGIFKDAAWFKTNAEEIYFGALTLPDGEGSAAVFEIDSTSTIIELVLPTTSPLDAVWRAKLTSSIASEESSLAEALETAGARSVDVQRLLTPEVPSADQAIPAGTGEIVTAIVDGSSKLGADGADPFQKTINADELAGALCTAAGRPVMATLAAMLLRPHSPVPVRSLFRSPQSTHWTQT